MMPGEDQVELEPPVNPDDFAQKRRVQKEPVPVSSGRGNPPEKYDALPLRDLQPARSALTILLLMLKLGLPVVWHNILHYFGIHYSFTIHIHCQE